MGKHLGAVQDFGGVRLQNVGTPSALTDGVPRSFIRYDWPTGCVSKPLAGEKFPYFVSPVAFTIPAGLVGSIAQIVGGIGVAATANATFTLYRVAVGTTTVSAVATLAFAAGATTGTFAMSSDLAVSRGDVLFWQAPATQDSTLSDFSIVVAGIR